MFLSLDPSERCRDGLALWQQNALVGRADVRAVASEALHVTLAFIGGGPEREIPEIARAALEAVALLPPARLRAVSVVAVPRRAPRLFALGLDDEGARAATIQAAASSALAASGFYLPEERAFWPHITFARVGRRAEGRVPPPAADLPGRGDRR